MVKDIFRNRIPLVSFFIIIVTLFLVHCIDTGGKFHFFEYLVFLGIFFTGIWFTRKTLLFFVPDPVASITPVILVFSTNLFYLVVVGDLLQPVLLFSLYAVVVYLMASRHRSPGLSKTVLLALFSALIIVAQPTGFLILLVPLLWGVHDRKSVREKFNGILKNYEDTLLFLACLLLVVLFFVLTWKIAPGEIGFLGFRLPGTFHLMPKYLWNDLFSFNHGWLIYSPVILFAFVGFYFLSEKHREIYYSLFIFCLLDLLVESCWTGLGSTRVFGQVAFIPLIAFLSIPFAVLLNSVAEKGKFARISGILLCVLFIVLNLFQTWQYRNRIIPESGMTPSSYCTVFGRTALTESEKMKIAVNGSEPEPNLNDKSEFRQKTLAFYDFEDTTSNYKGRSQHIVVIEGKRAFRMDSNARFSPALEVPYSELTKKRQVGARITVSIFVERNVTVSGCNLVITSTHEGKNYRYKILNLDNQKLNPGKWITVSFEYITPPDPYTGDKLVSYVWYTGNSSIYLDDLKFELFEPEE